MNKIVFAASLFVLPVIASAQNFGEVDTFFGKVTGFINDTLIPLVFALALLVFVYGMFNFFILGGASDDSREKGRQLIMWSIIAFVLMVSIWGVVNMLAGGLFPDNTPPKMPSGLER
tara:strand:- start:2221 stop:2571 length:351 start_codon:yes stop_codon:yes gene_type:complete